MSTHTRPGTHGLLIVALASALQATACKKEKDDTPLNVPPARGTASSDELSTAIGQARALSADQAPTSTKWKQVVVLDDKRAVLIGELVTETIALTTDNAGRTWRTLRLPREGWSTWAVGMDGTTAALLGPRVAAKAANDPRAGAPPPQQAGVVEEAIRVTFAAPDAPQLTALNPLVLPPRKTGNPLGESLFAGVFGPERLGVLFQQAPRNWVVLFGGIAGSEDLAPVKLPPAETPLPSPYGRPPMLLSSQGRSLLMRPFPEPDKPLEPPRKIEQIAATPQLLKQLATPPSCEMSEWSLKLIDQPRPAVLAVSPSKTGVVALPSKTPPNATIGCASQRMVVEVEDPTPLDPGDPTAKKGPPPRTLALCNVEGEPCVVPKQRPFRPWVEPHEYVTVSAPTAQGAVAVMTARAPARWGLYMAQSLDGGHVYELPRVIGEGNSDRGKIDIGAVVSFGSRVLLLLEAEVAGTSRRSWYVTASNDGGVSWGIP
ncbi:hypothetical protein [Chondromyces crocatus]|nr:hypothetical protein [Chondromyces crocatus]